MDYESVAAFTQSLSLLLFVGLFIGVLVYALWPGNKALFDHASRLPLQNDEDDQKEYRSGGGQN